FHVTGVQTCALPIYARVDSLAIQLSKFFGDKSSRQYLGQLKEARAKKQRYVLIKRAVSHQQLKALKQFPLLKGFKENKKRYSSRSEERRVGKECRHR